MARRRSTATETPPDEVRDELADRYRDLGARYRGLGAVGPSGGEVPPDWSPFDDLADDLEAGEVITLNAWQLPRWLPARPRRGRVRLERDGTITPA